ncbi:hypothetical protein R6L23_01115 [Streptomyces sp. SR27]|uniref:hypothetical protein n=1 Tax=Streptomyces sp. SR27 TaxID=3076630 RepID=UPI00295C1BF9|nr:hypothetical protein [Streptomyces sp. SR27]MDV9186846.1 hypothetical protein [Streptomyces sp. SR27]
MRHDGPGHQHLHDRVSPRPVGDGDDQDKGRKPGRIAGHEVVLRFRPGGPAILGVWSRPEMADEKILEWLGTHGQPGAVLTLSATIDGERHPVKSWTHEGGLQVAGAA